SKAEPLAEHGAKIAVALPELAVCDIVFCMVSTWDDVKEVVAGAGGLLSGNAKVIKAGRLSFVCSGPKSAFDSALPCLRMIAPAASYVGDGELARMVKIC